MMSHQIFRMPRIAVHSHYDTSKHPKWSCRSAKLVLLRFLLTAFFLMAVTAFPPHSKAQDWQLVWSDEFDGDVLDETKWSYQHGTGSQYGLWGWGNGELQFYTDREENIYIEDGKLHIVARQEAYANRYYTSARIRTINKGDWKYGKFEVRAKLPEGQGLWPAIWMLPTENVYGTWPASGEIDIMELIGHEPDVVHGTVHYGTSADDHRFRGGTHRLDEGLYSDAFHTFSIIWSPTRIAWYVDDRLYYIVFPSSIAPYHWPFDQKFHLLLNVAVGGIWPGSPDDSTEFPQEMVVEYVRVYQEETETYAADEPERSFTLQLHQNYPNPFNPVTTITFDLPEATHTRLEVFDMLGRMIDVPVNESLRAGSHSVQFDASELSSGTYIYRILTDQGQLTRLMQLVK